MDKQIKSAKILTISFFCLSGIADAQERVWKSRSGSSLVGSIESKRSDSITLKKLNGSTISVALSQLSSEDLKYVEMWKDPLEKGLIYYCSFDDKATNDLSGNNINGTLVGTTSGAPRDGKSGYSRVFDGRDDSLRLPIDINPKEYPCLTISIWAKPARTLRMGKIVSHDDGGYDRTLGVDTRGGEAGGDFQWVAFCGSGGVLGSEQIDSKDWVFLAVVYDQNLKEVTLYVDGRKYSKKGVIEEGHRYTNIGSNPSFGEFFDGNLDDLRIFSRVLTEEEILLLRRR